MEKLLLKAMFICALMLLNTIKSKHYFGALHTFIVINCV